jgi:hypothetical protein
VIRLSHLGRGGSPIDVAASYRRGDTSIYDHYRNYGTQYPERLWVIGRYNPLLYYDDVQTLIKLVGAANIQNGQDFYDVLHNLHNDPHTLTSDEVLHLYEAFNIHLVGGIIQHNLDMDVWFNNFIANNAYSFDILAFGIPQEVLSNLYSEYNPSWFL